MDTRIDDPAKLVESLDPDAIRARLAEIGRQERALRTLLRAADARRRHEARSQRQEVRHDS